jgi:hypothetical protein
VNATAAARNADADRFVVCDVALFYAERSGGIRTYLNEKARFARITGAFEHHLMIPGKRRLHAGGRHELPSCRSPHRTDTGCRSADGRCGRRSERCGPMS